MLAEVARAAAERRGRQGYLVQRFEQAVAAYERGRHGEVLTLLKPVLQDLPDLPPAQRLAGLAAYRGGRWREAVRHLARYRQLSGEEAEVPLVMDSYRALGRRAKVAELWASLRRGTAGADVVAEARIVAAATLADGGDLAGAISLLSAAGAGRRLRNPAERHLRQWYVLGDLYERAGDFAQAAEYFGRLADVDPEAYDVEERLAALGMRPGRRRRSRRGARREAG